MSRISFFTMLADPNMSSVECDAINDASDRADAAMEVATAQGEAFGEAIFALQRRMTTQDKELKLLRAAVSVLAAMLRDNNVVDADILDIRLEAAITNTEEEIDKELNTVTCLRCEQQLHRRGTVMTEAGAICDRCYALG